MSAFAALEQLVTDLCMVRGVDKVPRGHLRLETKFKYPDRSSVDLFVVNGPQGVLTPSSPVLSDLGQTMTWLADMQVRPWQSKKRQRLLEDTLYTLGVRQNGGALETTFDANPDSVEDAVIRLGQACVRVADLSFTRRSNLQVNATEEVEELISDAELAYEPNAPLLGRHGNVVVVDFLVAGRRRKSAVLTLSAQYPGSAHGSANEVFRKLYDLDTPLRDEQRVTVYDDRHDVYRVDDLERIKDLSELVPLSARQDFVALLAA
jgi:hypothetical protein